MLVAPSSKISSCLYFSSELLEMLAQGLMSSETTLLQQKPGLVTILSSDCEKNRAFHSSSSSSSSLRRTLSADMSSKKWLSQNGFFSPMMKKTVSSQKLSHSDAADSCSSSSESESSDDCEERRTDLEAETIWSAIQKDKNNECDEKPGAFDIWSSIVSQKTNEDASKSSLPPPYIHPLVKRSQSSLSEKSLQICTESLGSETGSDGFSSYPPSETGETEEDKDDEEEETEKETLQEHHEPEEHFVVPKFNYSATSKKSGPRSFPPPLPSLTRQDGPSVHMRSRRENGRLVLEAVSVPSQNNFCARRQDGRLLLTFNNLATYEEEEEEYDVDVDEMEEEFGEYEKDDDEEEENEHEEDDDEETEEDEIDNSETEQQAPILFSTVDGVYTLGLNINKPIGFANRNPRWSEKLNEVVNSEDVKSTTAAKSSLPPRPRVALLVPSARAGANSAVSSFNRYEYFWRPKSTNHHPQNNNAPTKKHIVCEAINQIPCEQQKLLVLKGKNGDCLVHNWRSCKESRSFLFRETQCIATSS